MKLRIASVSLAVAALLLAGLAQPAAACGCGAMVANDGMRVDGESSIVAWDGRTEQIVMRLAVDSKAPDAAWVFPTPAAATVTLGDPAWFGQIDAVTRPALKVHRDWWPTWNGLGSRAGSSAIPAAPRGVRLLSEQRLGRLVVATLDASDPAALAGWLDAHGYHLRAKLDHALGAYVRQHWKYVAVKLAPQAGSALRGQLDPLHVTFASPELIYPMRLSQLATTTQHVHVWVVARHEVSRADADATSIPGQLQFAGRLPSLGGSLGSFAGAGQWLTEWDAAIGEPERITADWTFRYASTDRAYRQVISRYDPVFILGIPGGWFLTGAGTAGLLVLALLVVTSRRRRATG